MARAVPSAVLRGSGDSGKAEIGEYEKLLASDPDNMIAMNNLGALYRDAGRRKEGLELMKRAADTDREVWNFQLNTSIAYTELGELDEALTYALRAQKAAPEVFIVRQQVCGLYLSQEMSEAVKCFEELLADKRADAMDLLGYGEALMMVRDFTGAEKVIRNAIDTSPGCALARNDLGITLYHLKRYGDAIDSLRQAVGIQPDSAQFRFNLAVADMAARDRAGAISQYRMLKYSEPAMADRLYKIMFAGQVVQAGP